MRSALFLDRDGVIISDAGYVKDVSEVKLLEDCVSLIRSANQKGWATVVVTNQSGLGRGWIQLQDYRNVSQRMFDLLNLKGVSVDAVYFAPFYPLAEKNPYLDSDYQFSTGEVPQRGAWDSKWRKPQGGMLSQASIDLGIDLQSSVMVGDRHTDLYAGQIAGVPRFIFRKSIIFAEEKRLLESNGAPIWISVEEVDSLKDVQL